MGKNGIQCKYCSWPATVAVQDIDGEPTAYAIEDRERDKPYTPACEFHRQTAWTEVSYHAHQPDGAWK